MSDSFKWTRLNRFIQEHGMVAFAKLEDQSPYAGNVTVTDLFGADEANAQLRDEFGDTPYAAPKVDRETGLCGGGDTWPTCCRGHAIEDFVMWKMFDEQD